MFFIEKVGVYGHGVFWIGESEDIGVLKCIEFSNNDRDNYHSWQLYKFIDQQDFKNDSEHKLIFETTKGNNESN